MDIPRLNALDVDSTAMTSLALLAASMIVNRHRFNFLEDRELSTVSSTLKLAAETNVH